MAVDPEMKMNKYRKGKHLLRHAFEEGEYLPDEILWREKAAFSDAVGHSMVDYLKAYAECVIPTRSFGKDAKNIHMPRLLQKNLFCTGKYLKNTIPVREK